MATWRGFLSHWQSWHILIHFGAIGTFGGFFIVPLYAMLQTRGARREVARVIAANNIANAVFIIASALFAIAMFRLVCRSASCSWWSPC